MRCVVVVICFFVDHNNDGELKTEDDDVEDE